MSDRLINRRELARKLGKQVGWTYHHLTELYAAGLPQPVIKNHWSEAAIDHWFAARSHPEARLTQDVDLHLRPAAELAEAAARLDRRVALLAGS